MISRTAQYALRAVLLMAAEPMKNHGAQEIALRIGAPPNYMGKLLRQLAAAAVLDSSRGSGGGFRLARSADEISLYDVVEPIDHVSRWTSCFLGVEQCGSGTPCGMHDAWVPVREGYLQMLSSVTVATVSVANLTLAGTG